MNLRERSINIIKKNQHVSGAYVASPNFKNYQYSWLRDGSFIAYAMDVASEYQSAEKFYRWVNKTIIDHRFKLEQLYDKIDKGINFETKDFLPCRYTLEGLETHDEWPNFQLDGYGTWLWGLSEHVKFTNNKQLLTEFDASIQDTVHYLLTFWNFPNSDCWEENEDKVHPSTLSCIYGGLHAINEFLHIDAIDETTAKIKEYLLENAIYQGRFAKYIGSTSVDASLLWLTVPFNVFKPDNPYIINTIHTIEELLLHEGGVHRYPEDTYYGGGEWLLLSSWLGWYYLEVGNIIGARKQLEWLENRADEEGNMTEQVLHHVNNQSYIHQWQDLWGPVANPLLWSHAMYIILLEKLNYFKKEGK